MPVPTVFLSYQRASSRCVARNIHDELERMGADVFFDVEAIEAGDRWPAVLERETGLRCVRPYRGGEGI